MLVCSRTCTFSHQSTLSWPTFFLCSCSGRFFLWWHAALMTGVCLMRLLCALGDTAAVLQGPVRRGQILTPDFCNGSRVGTSCEVRKRSVAGRREYVHRSAFSKRWVALLLRFELNAAQVFGHGNIKSAKKKIHRAHTPRHNT